MLTTGTRADRMASQLFVNHVDGVVVFVEYVQTFLGREDDITLVVFRYARDVVALSNQVLMKPVRTEHIYMIAIISAESATASTIPHKSLFVLVNAMYIRHWQLLLGGKFRQHIFRGVLCHAAKWDRQKSC